MITTMRITLALVSLGLLFHCVSSQSIDVISENQTDPIMTPSTTLTTVTSKALTTVLTMVTSEALTTVTSKAPITVPSVASPHTVPPSPSAAAETDPSKPPTQANVVAMKSSFSVAPSGPTATDKPHLITVVTSDPSQNSNNKVLTTVPVTSTSVGLRKLEDQGLDLFTTQGTNSTSHQPAGIPVTHGTQGPTAASDTKMALTPPPTMSTSGQQTTTATLITATATTTATTTTTNISVKDTVPGREWTTAQSIKTTIPSPTSAAAGSATVGTHTGVTGLRTKTFSFPMDDRHKPEENDMAVLCTQLMKAIALMAVHNNGSCTLRWTQQGDKMVFGSVDINSKVKAAVVNQYFDEIQKEKSPSSPGDRTTLIAILASCGTLLAMIIGLGIYATHHRKPYSENQQHLTEELHTVENGYHDNPTLEVMEVQPEMQEKKKPPCSECNEGYIVPMETALKEEFLDEEDTHL